MTKVQAVKKLVVTADDLGLSEKINSGIFAAHQNGIVTSASLLMNAPATAQALHDLVHYPDLEIGLHVSIVEGYSLRNCASSVTDPLAYFDQKICLWRDHSHFIAQYLRRKINWNELEEELDLQFTAFKQNFSAIPFINGTQHLHLLPEVATIILRLCVRHNVGYIRLLDTMVDDAPNLKRKILGKGLQLLSWRLRQKLPTPRVSSSLQALSHCAGFYHSGCLDESKLLQVLSRLPGGSCELIVHPGYDDPLLRLALPGSYQNFDWQSELNGLISPKVKNLLLDQHIKLMQFHEL